MRAACEDDVEITIYTPEHAPLEIFGPSGTRALAADLAEAGVRVTTGVHVSQSASGRIVAEPGGHDLTGDRVIALPRAVGHPVHGLATDDHGFLLTDLFGRVSGTDAVWAAGDATAFPIKQGGLAAQQADVVAQGIAAGAGAGHGPKPFRPVLRGVLLTGRGRAWMRRDSSEASDAGADARHALFWPPTKVAGRYLSPYLAGLTEREHGVAEPPAGEAVLVDLAHLPHAG